MINKRSIIFGLLGLALFTNVHGQEKLVEISGRIKGIGNGEIRVLDPVKGEIKRFHATQDNFKIEVPLHTNDQRFFTMHLPSLGDMGPSMKTPALFFMVDNDPINIQAHIEEGSVKTDTINGANDFNAFNATYKQLKSTGELMLVTEEYNKAFNAYNNVAKTEENLAALKAVGDKIEAIYSDQQKEITELIASNPKSLTVATLASQYTAPEMTPDAISTFLSQFDKGVIAQSFYLKELQNKLAKVSQLEVGQQAPDFTIKGADQKAIKLSDFKGKYVLLDFWASWCGPCRREMPHVKAAYEQFKGNNFQVFAVSIDSDAAAWKKALEEDNMPFVHALDVKGKQSVGDLYMVRAIPTNFLIDSTGKIIAKNLRGEELSKFLESRL
ncbi:TlpA family protein disulfide reductase [Sphingobacterium sp. UBA6645]|uniref:TlpA family protein disulfide reductase n=1 Tax=Sphingobacterium sp. UBA6645 TaxID=1947511 RepID=UPI0025F728B4|nr:TlpA disulfide reductase family protein [Sphingobacterium sp. UBA6645]